MVLVDCSTGEFFASNVSSARIAEIQAISLTGEIPPDVASLRDSYKAALARLQDIVTNGPTYTQAQARTAIVDMAQIQLATLKYLRAVSDFGNGDNQ